MKIIYDKESLPVTIGEMVRGRPYVMQGQGDNEEASIYVLAPVGTGEMFVFHQDEKLPTVELCRNITNNRFVPAGKVKITIELGP
jgi:hypothetical protein